MISFDVLSHDRAEDVFQNLLHKCPECDREYLSKIIEELLDADDGCEYALSAASGCLLVRVFDDGYYFLFPEPLAEDYDLTETISDLRLYSIREEIPFVICEVPTEYTEDVTSCFANAECECADEENGIFTVRAFSEISFSDDLPSVSDGDMSLVKLSYSDEKNYATLCRDCETNKYWGYNYSEDYPDCSDAHFIECVEREFDLGVAASFSVRLSDEFVGEAVLYAFDLCGGAECAVRLLPDYRGRSLSAKCVELLCEAARRLRLLNLYATVDNRNVISLKLFSKSFEVV